jgi:hypothetical protein
MSFDAKRTYNVPDQTAQVARAIFPKGNLVMRLHDDLHSVVAGRDFADLFPTRGRPAEARSCPKPWCRSDAPWRAVPRRQVAATGRLTAGVSLTAVMVSSWLCH